MCIDVSMYCEALAQAGTVSPNPSLLGTLVLQAGALSTASVLGFGFGLGLKHAVEADHLAAVSTIVSERKSLLSSSLVGGLWGVGHTISLFVVGIVVILLRVQISERTALGLEFGVALMLIGLGANAIIELVRHGQINLHSHRHGENTYAHPQHTHDRLNKHDMRNEALAAEQPTHHNHRIGKRPLLVGMVHGLAGSAALMLLVLSTISAPLIGMLYITVFGVGSIGGMMLMSTLVGLPMHLTVRRFARVNLAMRMLAGLFSIGFGLFMVYEIGFVEGLFR